MARRRIGIALEERHTYFPPDPMPYLIPELELGAYLRLNRASYGEWLAAIRAVWGCDRTGCRLHHHAVAVGALAALTSDSGHIVSLHASQGMDLAGFHTLNPVLLLPLTEGPEIAFGDGEWRALSRLLVALPEQGFDLRLPECSRVMLISPEKSILDRLSGITADGPMSDLENLIRCYLYRSRFFQNHAHAQQVTNELFGQMASTVGMKATPPRECSGIDHRLRRAINKIRQEPDWDFNLQELASHSGVSERNLYYLMKRETGMTPYRLYQRNRLMRVRQRLVDCQCAVPHISWYAADAGFSHLGRFAALYREHFGELPSETVQWRRNLQGSGVGRQVLDEPDLLLS